VEAAVDDRQLLAKLAAGRLSGDALARELGQTRAAIWKRIQGLRAAGVDIEGRAGEGYGLTRPVDLLDPDAIRAGLPADVLPLLHDLQVAWTVDSTNAELLRCSAPQRGVSVLLAERQTGGRGRRGRTWASPLAAHIYLSVLRLFSGGLGRLAGLSLVAGIAVAEALHDLGYTQAQLKWPNDLIVDGRKLVGLLAEGGGEYAGPARAVIGIGINTHMPPSFAEQITQPWVDLDTLAGKPVDRNVVVAPCWRACCRRWKNSIAKAWLRSCRATPPSTCWPVAKYAWNWKGSGSTAPRSAWPMTARCACASMAASACCTPAKSA
jgi:BirA family biotin operon repressor/biotin-[acetyl-CoA-carboxylase] ligase